MEFLEIVWWAVVAVISLFGPVVVGVVLALSFLMGCCE